MNITTKILQKIAIYLVKNFKWWDAFEKILVELFWEPFLKKSVFFTFFVRERMQGERERKDFEMNADKR